MRARCRARAVWLALLPLLVVSPASPAGSGARIDAVMAGLDLHDKIGQMIMCDVIGTRMNPEMKRFLDDIRPGGVTLFNYNISDATQLRRLNAALSRGIRPVAPFLTIDQEGGQVVRLQEDIVDLPGNMALGATRSRALSEQAAEALGEGLAAYGFNMNLAPVLDVNTNPDNPIIGTRSFSSDPRLVGDLGAAFINGLHARGIVAAGKHFPGHGDAAGDSHQRLPVLTLNGQQLRRRELVPFKEAIRDSHLSVIMTAHIALPGLHDGAPVPATLSKPILTDMLRHELGFDGIILTDGLEMQGLLDATGSIANASVKAVLAGADMVSVNAAPEDVREARDALAAAVRDGVISRARIDESVRRILRIKARFGILDGAAATREPSGKERRRFDAMAYDVSVKAATLIRNVDDALPLAAAKYRHAVVVGPADFVRRIAADATGIQIDSIVYAPGTKKAEAVIDRLNAVPRRPDIAIIAVADTADLAVVRAAARWKQPVAVVSLGSPYLLRSVPDVAAYLCLFSRQRPAHIAAADVVTGRKTPVGRLPVAIPGLYPFGHRMQYAREPRPLPATAHAQGPAGQM